MVLITVMEGEERAKEKEKKLVYIFGCLSCLTHSVAMPEQRAQQSWRGVQCGRSHILLDGWGVDRPRRLRTQNSLTFQTCPTSLLNRLLKGVCLECVVVIVLTAATPTNASRTSA